MTYVKLNNRPAARSFNNLLDDFLNEMPSILSEATNGKSEGSVPVNIHENKEAYQLQVVAPGFSKENFSIKLENQLLTILGEQKKEEKNANDNREVRNEYRFKNFKRSFHIDEQVDPSGISAAYHEGVLEVTLPKKPEAKAVAKEITIQ